MNIRATLADLYFVHAIKALQVPVCVVSRHIVILHLPLSVYGANIMAHNIGIIPDDLRNCLAYTPCSPELL